jgi:hypothetical protein
MNLSCDAELLQVSVARSARPRAAMAEASSSGRVGAAFDMPALRATAAMSRLRRRKNMAKIVSKLGRPVRGLCRMVKEELAAFIPVAI